jgi:Predicted membrane protein (DUF2085)
VFVAVSALWAVALPLAAYAASQPHTSSVGFAVTFAVYGFASALCHQLPERSFHLWGAQMPVCARCAGIYIGAAIAALAAAALKRRPATDSTVEPYVGHHCSGAGPRSADVRGAGARLARINLAARIAIGASIPTAATLAYEWTTGVTPANWIRAAAGVCLGAAVAMLIEREVN